MNAIRSRVPAAEYHALPGVSITRLKEIRRSPLHYKHLLSHPRETEPMKLGTAAHTAVLEPERFESQFIIWGKISDNGNMRPRRGKDWGAFRASYPDRTVITKEQYRLANDIAAAVRSNPDAMRYLESGDPEVSLEWVMSYGNKERQCRGRPDWITEVGRTPVLVGLKTARDCRHFIFGAVAYKLGYGLQWAFYKDGFKIITGKEAKVKEIVVESGPPHAVAVYDISDDIIEQGREEYRRLLKRLDECEETGFYPGPQETEEVLTFPSYAYESTDDITELGLEA